MADGGRTFTETEHFALLTDAVARETASLETVKTELEGQVTTLTAEKTAVDTEKAELQGRIDMLEAEKVAAEKARDEAVTQHETYVKGLEELAATEARKADRVAAVKEAAADLLDDEYFTDARVQRWAEMADDSFEQVITDFRDLAAKATKKTAPAETTDANDDAAAEKAARETAAFTGGTSPSSATGGSLFAQFMTANGRLPVAAS